MKATPARKITQERLKELLSYDHETGVFRWILRRRGVKYGSIAGYNSVGTYSHITIDGVQYCSHRLAWLYMEGYYPENEIDHINRKKK